MVLKNSKTACFIALNLYDRVFGFFLPRTSVDARNRATRSYSESVIDRGRLGLGIWITADLTFILQNPQRNTFCVLRDRTHARTYVRTCVRACVRSREYFVFSILFRFTTGSWFEIVWRGFVATLRGVAVTRLCSGSNRFQPQPESRLSWYSRIVAVLSSCRLGELSAAWCILNSISGVRIDTSFR